VKTDSVQSILSISHLSKRYASGHVALRDVSLEIEQGEIFALLGPNGAGKSTLINIVCGLVSPSEGRICVAGHDIARDYRAARRNIGLVPQELTTDLFETVWDTVSFSRGLFGKSPNPQAVERILRSLSLWEKKDSKIITLSGGMKRRVLIAKALSHEPTLLFLDEPTAGVDVTLRRDMWNLVRELRKQGVTIILTTHYIEEAEEMADRVGVVTGGQLILVEERAALMKKLGRRLLTLRLASPLAAIPASLESLPLALRDEGRELVYTMGHDGAGEPVSELLGRLSALGIAFTDLETKQSTLEDIFVDLVGAHS